MFSQPGKRPDNPLQEEKPFDFSELLASIAERFPPSNASSTLLAGGDGGGGVGAISEVRPVVRAVVVYGRSYCCPKVPAGGANKP